MTPLIELPVFARDLLSSPPISGDGVHNWLYRSARVLHGCGRSSSDIVQLLSASVMDCGRQVLTKEIQDAVSNSKANAWRPSHVRTKAGRSSPKWPTTNPILVDEIKTMGVGLADLWEFSPVRLGNGEADADLLVDMLFPGNPLLCVGETAFKFATKKKDRWKGILSRFQFMVPSPMSSVTGLTKSGRISQHTLNNTGERRYLVIEFDEGTEDLQAACFLYLAQKAPLVMVLHSGGKSLHGWFPAHGYSAAQVHQLFMLACQLGADKATWLKSQFVRIPEGLRNNGKRQLVYFFNPKNMPQN